MSQLTLPAMLHSHSAQGAYLSPAQVRRSERESDARLVRTNPDRHFRRGLGDAAQGTWLSPSQVQRGELLSAKRMTAARQFFGMGAAPTGAQIQALQRQAALLAQKYLISNTMPGGTHEAGARLYVDPTKQISTSYVERQVNLQPICDPKTGKCIRYATPAEVEARIAAKVEGQTAVGTGKFQLPGFYSHPTLGPWGVDPLQAYNYWRAQQAATQASPYGATPMSVWGSPGVSVQSPGPMQPSQVARPAAYDPINNAFPTAGTAVERF